MVGGATSGGSRWPAVPQGDARGRRAQRWVYDHEFFLLLNLAVGGNFGGPVGQDTVFPAEYRIDYVRVYEAAPGA